MFKIIAESFAAVLVPWCAYSGSRMLLAYCRGEQGNRMGWTLATISGCVMLGWILVASG